MPSNAGMPVPLNYGYNWITGTKLGGATLRNTGNDNLDFTRIGFWLLGEGEEDGLIEMWDTALGRLMFQANATYDVASTFHYHPGCDALIGGAAFPSSTGLDQGIDTYWSSLPPGLQPLRYNRWAYYALKLKWPINDPENLDQNNEASWADVNPVGLWRGLRCRLFDSNGQMSGYAFTRNPASHFVDLLCRRKLFPEYNIDQWIGPDDLPTSVARRFEWNSIADSSAYFAEVLANGMPRFCGDYSFAQQTSLQACLSLIMTKSRSFLRERNGTFAIIADKPRASVFTFSRRNADSFTTTDADLHSAPNRNIGKFRDILAPAIASIGSISCPDHTNPIVNTEAPHCAAAGDYLVLGNTGTRYDGNWKVASVPNDVQIELVSKGSNYPDAVGAGGLVGLRFSRFHERSPEFQHKAHQYARGAVGIGIQRQRNKVSVTTDFANSTWDEVARIAAYMRGVSLGPDVLPYVSPIKATIKTPLFAADEAGSGAVAIQIEPGDVVTVDESLSFAYAGLYEVMPEQMDLTGSAAGDGTQRAPVAGGLQLTLRPYSDDNYPDTAAFTEPGWPDVPLLPGISSSGTIFPLADGEACFFTGSAAAGDYFEMPDGFSSANLLCWASPQGYVEGDGHLHFIQDCDAYPNRQVQLIYNDSDGRLWGGDLNFAGITWRSRSSASIIYAPLMTYVELTLLGGEKICFGRGTPNSLDQIGLLAGYAPSRTIALGFPKSATDSGHPAHGFCAYITGGGIMHHAYQDGEGNHWEGPGQAMVVSFQNNMGTWLMESNGWWHCPLPGGKVFAIAGHSIYEGTPPTIYADTANAVSADGHIPGMTGMSADSIQVMPGPNGFQIVDHPTHGVKRCDVDSTLVATCTFEDGEGNVWGGSVGTFSLLFDTPTGATAGSAPPSDSTTWPGAVLSGGSGGGGSGGPGQGDVRPGNPPTRGPAPQRPY